MALVSDNPIRKAALTTGIICLLTNLIASSILFWQLGEFNASDFVVILGIGILYAMVIGGLGFVAGWFMVDWPVYIAYLVAGIAGIISFWLWVFSAGFFIFGSTVERLSVSVGVGWLSGSVAGMLSLVAFLSFLKEYSKPHTVSRLFFLIVTIITIISFAISASLYYFGRFIST